MFYSQTLGPPVQSCHLSCFSYKILSGLLSIFLNLKNKTCFTSWVQKATPFSKDSAALVLLSGLESVVVATVGLGITLGLKDGCRGLYTAVCCDSSEGS